MSEEWGELPEGWRWAKLAEVAQIGSGQVLPKHEPAKLFNYVALENVEQGTGRLIDFAPTRGADIASNKYKFTPEHVLYSKLRPYLQKALVPDFEGISATDLLPLKPNPEILDRRFLWRWLLSYDVLEYVTALQTGVKMPRLRTGDLEAMLVPLPPLPEQHRLVEKIERLFAESRTAREALERVPALLKRFRQAVLARAFQGNLTPGVGGEDEPASILLERIRTERRRKWEEGKGVKSQKYVEPEPPDTSDLPELPEGWMWLTVEQLVYLSQNGCGTRQSSAGIPTTVLRLADIVDGQIVVENSRRIKLKRDEIEKYRLEKGDLLCIRVNGSKNLVGRMMRFDLAETATFCDHFIRFRLAVSDTLSDYLAFYFAGERARRHIEFNMVSSAGQNTVSQGTILSIPIPMPPYSEAKHILAKIESLFAQAEAVERAVAVARRRAEKVEQAVLARAFRGEL